MAVALTPQRMVLAMAASQIGYSRWSDPKQGTKYARETQPVFWPRDKWLLANGIAYCDIFVTWVFWKALGVDFVKKGHLPAGASYNTGYRASHGGRVSKSEAAPGDVLVFDWDFSTSRTNHVGILEKRLSGDRFQTIEGNTSVGSSGSQSNGGRVARRVRKHSQVRYVIRPNWSKASVSAPEPSKPAAAKPAAKPASSKPASSKAPAFPLPRKTGALYYYGPASGPITSVSGKTRNTAVPNDVTKDAHGNYRSKGLYAWQKQMKARGWSIDVDGKFGPQTEKVVRQFQKNKGLGVDGKIGPGTWAAAWTEAVT